MVSLIKFQYIDEMQSQTANLSASASLVTSIILTDTGDWLMEQRPVETKAALKTSWAIELQIRADGFGSALLRR
jgi:hypothetical protein